MAIEPDYRADMKLPEGRACADCHAAAFCIGIGCTTAESTSCDYWPNRFRVRSGHKHPSAASSEGHADPDPPVVGDRRT
jgi:hypothetical protein